MARRPSPALLFAGLFLSACATAPELGASDTASPSADASQQQAAAWSLRLDDGAPTPPSLDVRLHRDGRELTLTLERRDDLFGRDYVELVAGDDGTLLPRAPEDRADALGCWYRGDVVDPGAGRVGHAAVRTCDGTDHDLLIGTVQLDGELFDVRPAGAADGEGRRPLALVPVTIEQFEDRALQVSERAAGRTAPAGSALGVVAPERFVELLVVNDEYRESDLGAGTEADTVDIVNGADAYWDDAPFADRIDVVLVGQVTFTNDPWTATRTGPGNQEVDLNSLLTAFNTWGSTTTGLPPHDARQLFTHDDLAGSTIGWTIQGGLCEPSQNGSLVDTHFATAVGSLTAAHELGHQFDMVHDGVQNVCASSGFVMQASTCTNCPVQPAAFSSCSVSEGDAYVAAGAADCTLDVPPQTYDGPTCGDGIVEGNEQCDCGESDCSTIDPCCDGSTCQLAPGATCSSLDPCCDGTCGIVPAGANQVCRAADTSCDFPETCDGVRASCPPDTFAPTGDVCSDDRGNDGACFAGDCVAYDSQCEELTGFSGGPWNGNDLCWTLVSDPCTKLYCVNLSAPNTCYSFTDGLGNQLLMDDGVPCDVGQQCLDGVCVDSSVLDATIDTCPNDPNKTSPGDCGCGNPDTDTDGDGTADCIDLCPNDGSKIAPGDCGCGTPDTDTDGDGEADCVDACPLDNPDDPDGDGVCTSVDPCPLDNPDDTDGDGTCDSSDQCPNDPDKVSVGVCGCGTPDTDTDGDGLPDCVDDCPLDNPDDSDGDGACDSDDQCPNDPDKTVPGTCGCGTPDTDTDGDSVLDCVDPCPADNPDDPDGDSVCTSVDPCPLDNPDDTDGDGTCDSSDQCPNDADKVVPGVCGCGVADTDTDGDGTADCIDVCPLDNPDDTDGDGTCDSSDQCPNDPDKTVPGTCGCGTPDTDTDGDSVLDCVDPCPADNPDDPDGDSVCTSVDPCPLDNPDDTDGDGTCDSSDQCPNDADKVVSGTCGCGVADTDTDGDGTADCIDVCPLDDPDDTDGDGACDSDDQCPADPDKVSPGTCGCGVPDEDITGDGVPDCTICGDDVLEFPETCDDGNRVDGDGCDSLCQTEAPPDLVLASVIPGQAGVSNTLRAEGATPTERIWFMAGRPGTTTIPGCGGATVDIRDPLILSFDRADASGVAELVFTAPPQAAGRTFRMVALELGTCRASVGVDVTW